MCILLYRKNATSDDRMPNMLDSICCSWAAFKKIPPCCKQRRITFTAKLLLYSVSHCHTVYEKTLQQFKVVVVVTFVKLDVICSYRGRLDCPVCKAKNRIRLDKHLENVHCEIEVSVLYSLHFVVKLECILMWHVSLTFSNIAVLLFIPFQKSDHKKVIRTAKRLANLKALKALRRSNPQPPMVTSLDIEQLTESSDQEEQSDSSDTREESAEIREDSSVHSPVNQSDDAQVQHQNCKKCKELDLLLQLLKRNLKSLKSTKDKLGFKPLSPPKRQK